MNAHAAPADDGLSLSIRGTRYPVVLPKLSDPRLHLAVVITTLQVLGQVAFHFRLSIAQILVAILTCAVLEVVITFRKQKALIWPASAMLTGNGVAFILRVPGTVHGDWWSMHGWWIYAGTAAVSLLSKYVIKWRGGHVFNPSNFGLVLCFLVLGRTRAEPLDFWWGPMSPWLGLAFAVIVTGGLVILSRLRLLRVAVAFWVSFAIGIAVLAAAGHTMTARWHLGPITGAAFWWFLLTSPEVLVFLFFMLTDPKTSPKGGSGPGHLRGERRPARHAADRADAHRVGDEGRAARRAHGRVRSAPAACDGAARAVARLGRASRARERRGRRRLRGRAHAHEQPPADGERGPRDGRAPADHGAAVARCRDPAQRVAPPA